MSDNSDWIDELYAEGADELPPAALDERIRATARQDVTRSWYRRPGRLTALATAASLVIAAMIVYYAPTGPETASLPAPAAGRMMDSDSLSREAKSGNREEQPLTEKEDAPEERSHEPLLESVSAAPIATEPAAPAIPAAKFEAMRKAEADQSLARQNGQMGQIDNAPPADNSLRNLTPADAVGLAAESPARAQSSSISAPTSASAPASAPESVSETGLPGDAAAQLAALCGALPGAPDNRVMETDAQGWYLTVTIGDDARHWRCQDGAWIEFEKPEPERRSEEQ